MAGVTHGSDSTNTGLREMTSIAAQENNSLAYDVGVGGLRLG